VVVTGAVGCGISAGRGGVSTVASGVFVTGCETPSCAFFVAAAALTFAESRGFVAPESQCR